MNHTRTAHDVATYKTEPYVVAADVYALVPHTGRGGWTWYTGAAGWLYRLIVESLLGLKLEDGRLSFTPCLPEDWKGFSMSYRYRETVYRIIVQQIPGTGASTIALDGVMQTDNSIPLIDDRQKHVVEVAINHSARSVVSGEQADSHLLGRVIADAKPPLKHSGNPR